MERNDEKKEMRESVFFSNQPNVKLSTRFGMAATQREDFSQQMCEWQCSVASCQKARRRAGASVSARY